MDGTINTDFDFLFGSWKVEHRRLKARLVGSMDWESFSGTSSTRPILGGNGNIEDNVIHFSDASYKSIALRSFNPTSKTWAIWWLDERFPHALDVPVIGSFTDGIGAFVADDVLDGMPIKVRFVWSDITAKTCRWRQDFSSDAGESWETNWTMDFTRTS